MAVRPKCKVKGCSRLAVARGFCSTHHRRWRADATALSALHPRTDRAVVGRHRREPEVEPEATRGPLEPERELTVQFSASPRATSALLKAVSRGQWLPTVLAEIVEEWAASR